MAVDSQPFGIAPPGYRLPPATRVGRVRLQVRDLQRSLEYYTQVLGLRTLGTKGGVATLGPHGDTQPVVELHERTDARPVPRHGLLGLYHFAVLLPDRPSLGRFARHIANLGVHAASADHAVSESIYLTDPDGLGIEVYADRPKSTWQVNGQELYITVEPLDLPGLVREGGLEPWTGSPAGTVIGHVHLYVGTLEHAEAFYHRALGFDKTAWTYPGALFFAADKYHHHLGTNIWAAGAPPATDGDARLLEWELVLPGADAIDDAAQSLSHLGHEVIVDGADRLSADPWGTVLRIRR
jgi:catechol 2,3-dioxygenase